MATRMEALLTAGADALKQGEWHAARGSFDAALELGDSGAARFGLGVAEWWLGETQESLRSWERAYAVSVKSDELEQAVLAAGYLCLAYRMTFGNETASNGWLARVASLVEEHGLEPMRGWASLCKAYVANDSGRPQAAMNWAREALDLAREFEDRDLRLCAAAELGAALVGSGRREEGMALLDEAMAGTLAGEAGDLDTVVLVSCRTITACSRAADVKRAVQWIRAADDLNRRYGNTHLYTTCRTHCGSVLMATGDWVHAESELQAALDGSMSAEPALHAEASAKLAELRLAQGRIDDAARLLSGREDQPVAAWVIAALHLARDEPSVAAALLRRRLRELDDGCLERAVGLDLLVEAEVAHGLTDDLAAVDLATAATCAVVVAYGERAVGRSLAAIGHAEAAVLHLERSLGSFASLEMPLECARTRLLLATVVAQSDRPVAVAEARAALTGFEALGAGRDVDAAAAFLRSLGVKAARSGPKGLDLLTRREREVLALLGEGLSNPDIAARLYIARKTAENHVANVLFKLGLRSRSEAAAYAVRHLTGGFPRP